MLVNVSASRPAEAETAHGEHVLEPFEQAGGGVGVIGTRLAGETSGGVEAVGRVRVVERFATAGQLRRRTRAELATRLPGFK